jgi:hypothetical protein
VVGPSIFFRIYNRRLVALWRGGARHVTAVTPIRLPSGARQPRPPARDDGDKKNIPKTSLRAWRAGRQGRRTGGEDERRAEGLGSSGGDATQSWGRRGPRLRAESARVVGHRLETTKNTTEKAFFQNLPSPTRDARHVTAVTPLRLPSCAGTAARGGDVRKDDVHLSSTRRLDAPAEVVSGGRGLRVLACRSYLSSSTHVLSNVCCCSLPAGGVPYVSDCCSPQRTSAHLAVAARRTSIRSDDYLLHQDIN